MMKIQSKKSSRAIKRALAFGMSLALAMSTLAVAPNADAAKKKVPKLGAKSKTLYYNKAGKKTYTLKVRKNGVKKITKTTWKTSKKSVVAISKKKNTSVKLTAKKAGKATITATVKYTVKGSSEAKTKKLTFKVTSKKAATSTKAPTTAPTAAPTAAPTVAPTAAPTATAEPTKEPTADPTKEPTAEPTKEPTAEPTQEPIVADVAKVEAIITNSIGGFESTVLAGQDATIQVKVTDTNGNPVANDNVVLTFAPDPNATATTQYQVQSLKVSTTNSKGIATFVVGPNAANVKATDADYRGTYDYSVTDASANLSAKGKLKVANLSYSSSKLYTKNGKNPGEECYADVVCLNGNADYADLVIGTNSNTAKDDKAGYVSITKNILGNDVQYVGSQQVSTKDEDHKVAFKAGVYLNIPSESKEESLATKHVQEINTTSGKYDTYLDATSNVKKLVVNYDITDLSNVSYATLNFNSLKVSKYTKVTVGIANQWGGLAEAIETYGGENTVDQKNFSVQISKDKLLGPNPAESWGIGKGIYVGIESEGQVDTDNNDGFDVKDITYVYKNKATVAAKTVALDSASVKWETVTPYYSSENEVKEPAIIAATNSAGEFASVKAVVPAFPYVGNAIIKCYDKNGNVKKYYTCGTKNKKINGSFTNVNVLDTASDVYEISEAEATNSVGTLTEKDGVAEVDSTTSGTTFLKGTITCTDENVKLDADSDTVYTSVMWNPVAKAAADEREAFVALEGQTITLKAQLVDANGNAVTTAGQSIRWNVDDDNSKGTYNKLLEEVKTDAKGQATLKLNADKGEVLVCGVTAEEDSKLYDVVFKIGDKTVKKADLYWISLALQFKDKVGGTLSDTERTGTAAANAQPANVGDNWEYATKVRAVVKTDRDSNGKITSQPLTDGVGALKNWKITGVVNGVVPTLSKSDDAVGTVTLGTDGIAKVSSTKVGSGVITSVLNADTKYEGAKIVVLNKLNGWETKQIDLVGEGIPSVDETLAMTYTFAAKGVAISFADPMGTKSAALTKNIYLKVTDSQGNALEDKFVKLSSTENVFDGKSAPTKVVQTDENGIATTEIGVDDFPENVTVTANLLLRNDVDAVDSSVVAQSTTYRFVEDTTGFKVVDDGMKFESPNVVTLTMNENVLASSVIKELFTVKWNEIGAGTPNEHKYKVKSVEVAGKKITITLDANITTFDANDEMVVAIGAGVAKDGIAYSITSTTGAQLAAETYTMVNDETSTGSDAQAASGVVNLIDQATDYDKVKTARDAYNALSKSAKKLVASDKKATLDVKAAVVADIDTAIAAIEKVLIKASGNNVDALTAKVRDAVTSAGVASGLEAVSPTSAGHGSDSLVVGVPVEYTVKGLASESMGGISKTVEVTPVVDFGILTGPLASNWSQSEACSVTLNGSSKLRDKSELKITFSANKQLQLYLLKGSESLLFNYGANVVNGSVEDGKMTCTFNLSTITDDATFDDATLVAKIPPAALTEGTATVVIHKIEIVD